MARDTWKHFNNQNLFKRNMGITNQWRICGVVGEFRFHWLLMLSGKSTRSVEINASIDIIIRIVTFSKYETANHPQLLKDLEWLSVHNLIKFDTAALMYKVHNEIVSDPIIALFDKTEAIHKYSTRSVTNQNYFLKRTNLNKGERGISVAAVKVWNDLPASIKESESLEIFKFKLKHLLLSD